MLERNPLKGLSKPKERSPKRPVLSDDRYHSMLAVAAQVDWRLELALVLTHETGHRIGAIRQLRWSDVDLDGATVRWRKSSDKIGMDHETPLTEAALSALEAARHTNPAIGDGRVAAVRVRLTSCASATPWRQPSRPAPSRRPA